jgi:Nucleotidyl transferase AbiEii toxin, Type IV TA system
VSGRDIGASVRQRLLNKSRTQGRPFQELLQYFAMERFLYRLAKSRYSDRFVLKGALLLTAWRAPQSRPTMDIDLSRMYVFEGERLVNAISATFRHRVTTVEAERIGLTQAYCDDPARAIQWRAFVRRSRFSEEAGELVRLVTEIRQFALPMLSAIAAGNPFKALWKPGGPWE